MKNGQFVLSFLSCLLLSSCGVQKIAEDTRDQVTLSNTKQDKLLEVIHNQTLSVCLDGLLAENNTRILVPPSRMLPYGEVFAKEATSEELIQQVHVLLQGAKINPPIAKDSKTVLGDYKPTRDINLAAAGVLASAAPQEKVEAIVQEQILNKGRFEESAYTFLLLRYLYIKDFRFNSIVDSDRNHSLNLGGLREASRYFDQMKYVYQLPCREKLKFEVKELTVDIQISESDFKDTADTALENFKKALPAAQLQSAEVKKLLGAFEAVVSAP